MVRPPKKRTTRTEKSHLIQRPTRNSSEDAKEGHFSPRGLSGNRFWDTRNLFPETRHYLLPSTKAALWTPEMDSEDRVKNKDHVHLQKLPSAQEKLVAASFL